MAQLCCTSKFKHNLKTSQVTLFDITLLMWSTIKQDVRYIYMAQANISASLIANKGNIHLSTKCY